MSGKLIKGVSGLQEDQALRVRWFKTTHWSLIFEAARTQTPGSKEALSSLCQSYWYPLFAYAKRRGFDSENSRDLTQGFFTFLLEKKLYKLADASRGRFRSFLLTSFRNFIANEWERVRAQKRGGQVKTISFDAQEAEGMYRLEPVDPLTPDQVFEREWAMTILRRVLDLLEREMEAAGLGSRFSVLKPYLTGTGEQKIYRDVGDELGISEAAVKVAVLRMRRRYGALLRIEIAQTIDEGDSVEDEIHALLEIVQLG